jgi:cytochrome c-type biogenesis protein CcmH/NrfG
MTRGKLAAAGVALCGASLNLTDQWLEESNLLQALHVVEQRNFDSAIEALASLCPFDKEATRRRADAGDVACKVRMFVVAESRGSMPSDRMGDVYWLLGEQEKKLGNYDLAYGLLRVSLDRKPGDATTWLSMAHVYRDTQQFEKAEQALARALEITPADPYVVYWMATVLMDQGRLEEAEAEFGHALELDSTHARVWFRLGELRLRQGQPQEALELFEKARSLGVEKKAVREKIRECNRMLKAG